MTVKFLDNEVKDATFGWGGPEGAGAVAASASFSQHILGGVLKTS